MMFNVFAAVAFAAILAGIVALFFGHGSLGDVLEAFGWGSVWIAGTLASRRTRDGER